MTIRQSPYRAREAARPDVQRSGFAASALGTAEDRQNVPRRDDLDIEANLDDLDEELEAVAARVQTVAYLHVVLSSGAVSEVVASYGATVTVVAAGVSVGFEPALDGYSVAIDNQLDTPNVYRAAVRSDVGLDVVAFDAAGAPVDLSAGDHEWALSVRVVPA